MIFMGEEGGEKRPFLFFCDFEGELGDAVRNGRRAEFRHFPEFADADRAAAIPDPLADATFLDSKIDWDDFDVERWRLYQTLLAIRRRWVRPLLPQIAHGGRAEIIGEQAVRVVWAAGVAALTLDVNLASDRIVFPPTLGEVFWACGETGERFGPWSVRWSVNPS